MNLLKKLCAVAEGLFFVVCPLDQPLDMTKNTIVGNVALTYLHEQKMSPVHDVTVEVTGTSIQSRLDPTGGFSLYQVPGPDIELIFKYHDEILGVLNFRDVGKGRLIEVNDIRFVKGEVKAFIHNTPVLTPGQDWIQK